MLNKRKKQYFSKTGFTLLETVVVISIMAVILVSAGLSIYFLRRNDLLLEQAAQELAAEIRVIHSKSVATKEVTVKVMGVDKTFTPKGYAVSLTNSPSDRVNFYVLEADSNCNVAVPPNPASLRYYDTLNLNNRAVIESIENHPMTIMFSSPSGKFSARRLGATLNGKIGKDSINDACYILPAGNLLEDPDPNNDIKIILSDTAKKKRIDIFIDPKTGTVRVGSIY